MKNSFKHRFLSLKKKKKYGMNLNNTSFFFFIVKFSLI